MSDRHPDAGMSLVELTVGSMVALVIAAVVVAYIVATVRVDRAQEADLDAMDELQLARAQLVKELRFARSVTAPAADTVSVWIDVDGSGGTGPDAAEEDVTWAIVGTELVRYEGGDASATVVWARSLDAGSSSLDLAGNRVSLVLVSLIDRGVSTTDRTLRGTVTVRNTP